MTREAIKEDMKKKAEAVKSTAITTYAAPAAPVAYDPFAATPEDFSGLKPSLPWMSIDQKKGQFVAIDGSRYEELTVVIGGFPVSRVMFAEEMGSIPSWYCRVSEDTIEVPGYGILNPSLDAETQASMRFAGAGGRCSFCHYKDWVNNEKPRCKENINLLLYLGEEGFHILKISGTGLKPTNNFLNMFRGKGKKPCGQRVLITLEEQRKAGMAWYIPAYKHIEQITLEELQFIEERKAALKASLRNSLEAEPAEPQSHEYAAPVKLEQFDVLEIPEGVIAIETKYVRDSDDFNAQAAIGASIAASTPAGKRAKKGADFAAQQADLQRIQEEGLKEMAVVEDAQDRVADLWNKYCIPVEDREESMVVYAEGGVVQWELIEKDLIKRHEMTLQG